MTPLQVRAVLDHNLVVRKVLNVNSPVPINTVIKTARLSATDIILPLLRANTVASLAASEALGAPPVRRIKAIEVKPLPSRYMGEDDRVVTWVGSNPRVGRQNADGGADARERFDRIKVGMTIRSLLCRGVRRRDIREALEEGWIRVGYGAPQLAGFGP